jgi:hypothetical protein
MKKGIVLKMGKRQKKERLMKTFWRLCVALFVCCKDVIDHGAVDLRWMC